MIIVIKPSKCPKNIQLPQGEVFHFRLNQSHHQVTFLCDSDYELSGGYGVMTCGEKEGVWHGNIPNCTGNNKS